MMDVKPGRNAPCPCGSGKKYKQCCGKPESGLPVQSRPQKTPIAAPGSRAQDAPPADEISRLVALYNACRHAELENRSRLLVERHPDSGLGWKLLSASLLMQGKDALLALQSATKFLSGEAELHSNLGHALMKQGRGGEAEASFRRALQIKPDYADAHYNLSRTLLEQGRLDEAEASLRRALKIKPDFVDALNNLGTVLMGQGRFADAAASFRQALKVQPGFADAHSNLGNAYAEQGLLAEAEANLRLALEIKPDFADAHCILGNCFMKQGRSDEAEASLRRALEIKPDFADAHCNLGGIFTELGRIAEAEASLRRALEIKPNFAEARYSMAQIRRVKADDENLAALVAIEEAAQSGVTPLSYKDTMLLHFALGKCYDDTGEHEKAFPHFIKGCQLRGDTLKHDKEQVARRFATIMRIFDRAAMDRLRGAGNPSHLPIFILGMPRSGTTLTEQIIASHPEVHGAGELPDLTAIMLPDIAGVAFPDNLGLLDQALLAAWGAEYVAGLQRHAPDAHRITDKMPANFFAVGLIHLMLPNAKIIHVNRNPVDTCLSCFSKLFTFGQEFTYDLAELGRYYVGYARLMEHWRNVLPAGAFLDVQYEDIVADQEAQSRRIIEYCGLEWSDACIDFHKNKRSVRTASVTQVRQPIYRSSVERWRPYEKFLGPLLDALGDLVPGR
jgi:tetratricopeptide (TPR) repeat protein